MYRSDDDLAVLKFGYKRTREFARRMACYEGEYTPAHPVFDESSPARCTGDVEAKGEQVTVKPVPVSAPRLAYSAEEEQTLDEYVRRAVVTAWHFVRLALY